MNLSRDSPKLFSLGTGDCSNHCEHHIVPNDDLRSYSCDRNKETEIPIFRGVYTFPVDPIPRKNCFDEEAMQFLQDGVSKIKPNPAQTPSPACVSGAGQIWGMSSRKDRRIGATMRNTNISYSLVTHARFESTRLI